MKEILILKKPLEYYLKWGYKNTALLAISLLVFFYFAESNFVTSIINRIGSLGYLGAFLAGALFVSVFTVAPAAVIIFYLADVLNPIEVAILAGLGGVLGDYIIFRFLRGRVYSELKPVLSFFGGAYITKIFKTPYFAWLLPLIGAVLIASPLPDEVGVGIIGISKLRSWQFLILTFLLNTIGLFIIITLARIS